MVEETPVCETPAQNVELQQREEVVRGEGENDAVDAGCCDGVLGEERGARVPGCGGGEEGDVLGLLEPVWEDGGCVS